MVHRAGGDSEELREQLQRAVFPRYRVEGEIGHGGMAFVFRGWDTVECRAVAFKVLKHEYASVIGPTRFLREIRLLSHLHHPGILPLLDSGHREGLFYYSMPLVEGETLQARLEREPQLTLEVVRRSSPRWRPRSTTPTTPCLRARFPPPAGSVGIRRAGAAPATGRCWLRIVGSARLGSPGFVVARPQQLRLGTGSAGPDRAAPPSAPVGGEGKRSTRRFSAIQPPIIQTDRRHFNPVPTLP